MKPTQRIQRLPRLAVAIETLLLATLLAAPPSSAGLSEWTSNGPEGGSIRGLLIDPTEAETVLAATGSNGVFRSENGGLSWTKAGEMPTSRADKLARAADGGIYAMESTTGPEIVFSGDNANSWLGLNVTGLESIFPTSALVTDPNQADTLWIGSSSSGPYRSLDGALSWSPMNAGIETLRADSIALDGSTSPSTIYVGSLAGIYKSVDGGLNWSASGLEDERVIDLAVDLSVPGLVYAASRDGVYQSTDAGANWELIRDGSFDSSSTEFIRVDPTDSDVLLAGTALEVYRSRDRGETWNLLNLGVNYEVFVEALAIRGDLIVVGTLDGPHSSDDGGDTFRRSVTGLLNSVPSGIVADRTNPNQVYYGTLWDGLFASSDKGETWTPVTEDLAERRLEAPLQSPVLPDTVLTFDQDTIYRSEDKAQTWHVVEPDPNDFGAFGRPLIIAMAFDPVDTDTLYATNYSEIYTFLSGDSSTPSVLKSTDGGTNWETLYTTPQFGDFVTTLDLDRLAVAADDSSRIFAAGYRFHDLQEGSVDAVVFRSLDGGETWEEVFFENNSFTFEMVMDPTDSNRLYLALFNLDDPEFYRFYVTGDSGDTWTLEPGAGGVCIQDLLVDPANPSRLYGVCDKVQLSEDFGANWGEVDTAGLPDDENFLANAVALDEGVFPKTLHIGSNWGAFSRAVNEVKVEIAGSCPSDVTTTVSGGTPNGRAALLTSVRRGDGLLQAGPCAGLQTELLEPSILTVVDLDESGSFSFTRPVPPLACILNIQAVDVDTCFISPAEIVDEF